MKPRYRRIDQMTESLHFFHYYAVQDRIDLCGFPDEPNPCLQIPTSEWNIDTLLPSSADKQAIMHNFGVLVARVLVEEIPYFGMTFEGVVTKHIEHEYMEAMSKKSKTVSYIVS